MRQVSGDKLTHEVTANARTFYRNQDLEVLIGGDQAMTNGKTVYLPTIPLGVDYDEDEVRTIRGFVDHEAGHGRHTNFSLGRRKKYKELMAQVSHFMPITNGLEDVRIERLITQEYPGSKRNLEATSQWANKLFLDHWDGTPPTLDEIGAVAITWEGRRRMGYDDPTIQQCLDTLSDEVRAEVEGAVDKLSKAKSTKACMDISEELCKQWGLDQRGKEEEQQEQQGGSEEGEDESEDSNQSSNDTGADSRSDDAEDAEQNQGENADDKAEDMSGGEGEAKDEEGTEGSGDNRDDQGTQADGQDSEHKKQVQKSAGHGFDVDKPKQAYDPNLDKAMQNIVQNKEASGGSYVAHGRKYDVHEKAGNWSRHTQDSIEAAKRHGAYKMTRDHIGSHMNKMRRNLERALVAKQDRSWRSGYEEGTLDSRRLSRAVSGDTSVYRKRTPAEDMDTCVMLCIDASGSMGNYKCQLAMQSAVAMGEVFEKVGIPYAVTAFNTRAHTDNNTRAYNNSVRNHQHVEGRSHCLSTYLLKDYDESLRQTKHQIAAYEMLVGSGNTDGDSLMYIKQAYVDRRHESRNIMFVFSDGEPVGTNEDAERSRLKNVCADIEKQIELVGFGIMTDVDRYYSQSVQVDSLDEMSGKVMKQVASMLLGQKFKVDAKEVATNAA